jgi:hypothetical protein
MKKHMEITMNKQQTDIEALASRLYPFSNAERNAFIAGYNQFIQLEKEQNDKPLDEKVFNLANEFAVAGYGDIAVRLHSIHNEFLKYKDERIRR